MSDLPDWLKLMKDQRWAALGTISKSGTPLVSSVAYHIAGTPLPGLLMHLSELAAHTGNLLRTPDCSLLISEPDTGIDDPQLLRRLSLVGIATLIPRESEDFGCAAKQYIERFPNSEMRFGLGGFHLFRFVPKKANYVGGFGAAEKISGDRILEHLK